MRFEVKLKNGSYMKLNEEEVQNFFTKLEESNDLIEKFTKTLSKCSPFSRRGLCEFCSLGNWEHMEDCEYVLLTNDTGEWSGSKLNRKRKEIRGVKRMDEF